MTIIIAHASKAHQIIVADRQITEIHSGTVIEDTAYKIIHYANISQRYNFAAAFTGFASLGTFSTLDWLMKTLPEVMNTKRGIGLAISDFTSACTDRFNSISGIPLHQKGVTFIFCGKYNEFGADQIHLNHIPFLTLISNSISETGTQISSVSNDFRAYSARLQKSNSQITLCRGDLAAASKASKKFAEVRRLLRRRIRHQAKIRIAADYIKLVHNKSSMVGESVLGIALLQSGMSEGYDFTIKSGYMTKTIPHFVSADGFSAVNISIKFLGSKTEGQ